MKRCVALVAVAGLFFLFGCIPDIIDPAPNPDPGPSPTPGDVLFFDDFNDGTDPGWDLTVGWTTAEENLLQEGGVTTAWGYVRAGADWTDYAVEATVDPRSGRAGLVARCSEDLQTYILASGTQHNLRLEIYVDGEYFDGTGDYTPGMYEGEQTMRLEVEGEEARVYLNGNLRISFTGVPRLTGLPGVYANRFNVSSSSKPRFDDFSVTALD